MDWLPPALEEYFSPKWQRDFAGLNARLLRERASVLKDLDTTNKRQPLLEGVDDKEGRRATSTIPATGCDLSKSRRGRPPGLTVKRKKRLLALQKLKRESPGSKRDLLIEALKPNFPDVNPDIVSQDLKWLKENAPIEDGRI